MSKVGVDIGETHPGFTLDNFRKELADSLVGGFLQVECLWFVCFVLRPIDKFIRLFKAVPVMIREERYLEAETYSAEEESDRDRLGACLMAFGRRVTDLAEEYVPKVKRPISSMQVK